MSNDDNDNDSDPVRLSAHEQLVAEQVEDPALRLSLVLAHVDSLLDGIVGAHEMYANGASQAELLVVHLLGVRSTLLKGAEAESMTVVWRRWCTERYPELSGAIRCIAAGVRDLYPGREVTTRFASELAVFLEEMRVAQAGSAGPRPCTHSVELAREGLDMTFGEAKGLFLHLQRELGGFEEAADEFVPHYIEDGVEYRARLCISNIARRPGGADELSLQIAEALVHHGPKIDIVAVSTTFAGEFDA